MGKLSKPKQDLKYSDNLPIWFIGFTNGNEEYRYWWTRFLKRGFRHVFMYTFIDPDRVIMMNMTPGGLKVEVLHVPDAQAEGYENVAAYIRATYTATVIIPIFGQAWEKHIISRLAPFTCVELVRSITGIPNQIYTPWQLYRYLVDKRLATNVLAW